jgi:hypothetical protein
VTNKMSEIRDRSVTQVVGAIKLACHGMLKQKRPPGRNRKPVYWWNGEVAAKRRSCLEAKGMLSRANRSRREQGEAESGYKRARMELKAAIRKAKEKSWAKLVEEVNNEP